jgi:putative endonuclease
VGEDEDIDWLPTPPAIVIAGLDPAIQVSRRSLGVQRMYHVYIVASGRNGTLYIGVTGDLARRAYQHRMGEVDGFTKRHGVKMLVHVEAFDWIEEAIRREKTLKKWPRRWKLALIESENPEWRDLYEDLA